MQDTTLTSGCLSNIKPNCESCLARQVDERIKAEIRDPASKQVIEPGLCDPEPARSLCLRHLPTPHALLDRNKQVGAHGHTRASAGVFSKASHTLEKLWRTIVTPPLDLPQSCGGKVQISSGRLLRLLLEGMQHKNGILYSGDVKHSECPGLVADADFPHSLPTLAIGFQSLGSRPC